MKGAGQWAGLGWHSGAADRISVVEGNVERSPGQWPLLGMAVVPTRPVVSVVPASTMLSSVKDTCVRVTRPFKALLHLQRVNSQPNPTEQKLS